MPDIESVEHDPAFATPTNAPVTVVFCTDENYAPYTGVAIRSLVEHFNPARALELVVFTDRLDRDTRKRLEACAGARPDSSFTFVEIEPFLSLRPSEYYTGKGTYISKAAYYRLYAPTALAHHDRAVYLDSDVIVLGDVAELQDSLGDEDWIAACTDFAGVAHCTLNANHREHLSKTLKIEDRISFFNSGVMAMNLRAMRSDSAQEKIAAVLRTHQNPRFHDQDILNIACAGRVRLLDHVWNYAGWYEHIGDLDFKRNLPAPLYANFVKAGLAPKIAHYLGPRKPWHHPDMPWAGHFWECARKTPFYEQLLMNMTLHRIEAAKRASAGLGAALAKYRLYYVLSLFTMGDLRRHFIKLRDNYKARSDSIRKARSGSGK